jgi:polar amino acid transport system substrate-binding protein
MGLAACGGDDSGGEAGAATAGNPLKLVKPGVLTVANFGTQYPAFIINGNSVSGMDGDLLTAFAKKHNLKIKLFTTSFASTILAVQQHKADLAVNFYWSEERSQHVKYGVPYYQDYSVAITNKERVNYSDPSSLKGKKIGVIVGTIYTPVVKKSFPAGDTTIYPGIPEAGKALINGQIDALIESSSTLNAPPLAGSDAVEGFPIKPGEFGFTANDARFPTSNIFGCKNDALAKALDDELKAQQDSGAWDTVVEKYKQYGALTSLVPPFKAPAGGCNG